MYQRRLESGLVHGLLPLEEVVGRIGRSGSSLEMLLHFALRENIKWWGLGTLVSELILFWSSGA